MRYEDGKTPADYACTKCGAANVKLWRQYQTFLNHIKLYCCDCAAEQQSEDISDIDHTGRYTGTDGRRHDQIGWLVPAIPTEDESTYWGYSSVPTLGILWWRGLPTRPGAEAGLFGIDMMVSAIQKDLKAIAQISSVAELICPGVLDVAKRLAKLAAENRK